MENKRYFDAIKSSLKFTIYLLAITLNSAAISIEFLHLLSNYFLKIKRTMVIFYINGLYNMFYISIITK